MTSHRPEPADGGFTLIEALVVLTITALAFAFVPVAVSFGQRALQVAAKMEQSTSDRRGSAAVKDRLASARAIFQTNRAGLATLIFEGRSDRLRFVTEFSDGPSGGGYYLATLQMNGANTSLVLSLAPFPDDAAIIAATTQTIVRPATSLSLRYFGLDGAGVDRVWQPGWTASGKLPEMVEVSVMDQDGQTTTDIIALRLGLR